MIIEKVLRKVGLSTVIGSVLCLSMCGRAYAKDARLDIPDLNKTGSIYVEMHANDTGEPIAGGTMTLYKIGRYVWWNNMYQFKVDRAFTEDVYSHYLRFDMLNDELAHDLLEYADKNDVEGETQAIDDNGAVNFKNLQPGLYLLSQKEPPEGYYSVKPFFVTLPLMNDMTGVYDYNVDASPKTQKLEPVIKPAPLEPAWHDMAELEPAYHDMAELEPAFTEPAEIGPAYHNPAETEHPTSPDQTPETSETSPPESEPEAATPSDAKADDGKPGGTSHHRNTSNGGGSAADVDDGMNSIVIEGEVWEIVPMPATGERWNILIAGVIFALSGILLAVIAFMRFCIEKKSGRG